MKIKRVKEWLGKRRMKLGNFLYWISRLTITYSNKDSVVLT